MSELRPPEETPRTDLLRSLPQVEQLATAMAGVPHRIAVSAARAELATTRSMVLQGEPVRLDYESIAERTSARAARLTEPSLRPVINATGVILHTNLGRAPLAPQAVSELARIASGYSSLEYDLERGERGARDSHVAGLLCALAGSEAATAVNNNAAAILLALAATASGREVVVSRGHLVEIGGSFRIHEILAQSGARLVEVGSTNRTRVGDYERAIGPETAAILRVHQSNFRTVGFVEDATLDGLVMLAERHDLALIDDLGSGAPEELWDEPTLRASVAAGADLVCASADKLLGGPQAGIILGKRAAIERCRRHPLARAIRLDKLQLASLSTTVRHYLADGSEAIPALSMLHADEAALGTRAEAMAAVVGDAASVGRAHSKPGGGSLPMVELEGPICKINPGEMGADELLRGLRSSDPPIIARIEREQVVLDPRTMSDDEAEIAARSVRDALS